MSMAQSIDKMLVESSADPSQVERRDGGPGAVNPPEPAAIENPYRAPDDVAIGERSRRRWRLAAGILIAQGVLLTLLAVEFLAIDIHNRLRTPKGLGFEHFSWRAEIAMFIGGICLTASGVFLWRNRWRVALICGIPAALFASLATRL